MYTLSSLNCISSSLYIYIYIIVIIVTNSCEFYLQLVILRYCYHITIIIFEQIMLLISCFLKYITLFIQFIYHTVVVLIYHTVDGNAKF